MNEMKKILIIPILFCVFKTATSQDNFKALLDSVAINNKSLTASHQLYESQKLDAKTGIYLANPSVSYDRLSSSSGNYSEMIVSQSFDFPSAYFQKGKIADLTGSQAGEFYRQAKLEVLLSTAQVYAELISANRKISILSRRNYNASQLQAGIEKRLNTGDVNIFEMNRVRSELAKVQSELNIEESRYKSLTIKLTELNGGQLVTVKDSVFPVSASISISDSSATILCLRNPQLRQWETQIMIEEQNVSLQRSLSLPKFEIGYRQDLNLRQTYGGIHAGITIPLFENKNTVKSAKARHLYASEAIDAYRIELKGRLSRLISDYQAVLASLNNMNGVFRSLNTPELLLKAYRAGQINYTEFFSEYENYQQTALYIEDLNRNAVSLQLQLFVMSGI